MQPPGPVFTAYIYIYTFMTVLMPTMVVDLCKNSKLNPPGCKSALPQSKLLISVTGLSENAIFFILQLRVSQHVT